MALTEFEHSEPGARIREALGQGLLDNLIAARRYRRFAGLLQGLTESLITTREMERAIARQFIPPETIRMYAGRSEVDLDLMKVKSGDRLDLAGVSQLLAQGVTIVVNQMDRRISALSDLAFALNMWLGEEIEASCILSFGGRSGIAEHQDAMNLFIVQLEGAKVWNMVGDPVPPGWSGDKPLEEGAVQVSLTMEAGDVMFVPAGQRHWCSAETVSLHLVILIHHKHAGDIMADFGKRMATDPALNAPLLGFLGAGQEAATIAAYKARLHQLVDEWDLAGELGARREAGRLERGFEFPSASRFEKRSGG